MVASLLVSRSKVINNDPTRYASELVKEVILTREQNVVATAYLFVAAAAGAFSFHRFSVFIFIGFLLAFVLKVVNSVARRN